MSSYRIVTRAYPRRYWSEHGEEIIATANEINDDSWSFRESRQLLSNGLRTRGLEATDGEPLQVWVHGLALLILIAIAQLVGSTFGSIIGITDHDYAGSAWQTAVIGVAAFAMTFTTRWQAVVAVAVAFLAALLSDGGSLITHLVVVAAFTAPIAFFSNGRRVMSPIAFIAISSVFMVAPSFWATPAVPQAAMLVLGLATVRFDPRLLAATAVFFAGAIVAAGWYLTSPDPYISPFDELIVMATSFVGVAICTSLVTLSTRRTTLP